MNGSLTWFWLSLFFALWTSILTSVSKHFTKSIHPLLILFLNNILSLPFIFAIVLLTGGIPNTTSQFWLLTITDSIIDTIAGISSIFAISMSAISLISPISSFNPVFTTIIAAITLNEIPSSIKLLGILIVVIGAYLLNASEIKGGILLPFKKLFSNKGVLLFLLANFIWGVTPVIQKLAISQTEPNKPIFVAFTGGIFVTLFLIPFVLAKVKNPIAQIKGKWYWFLLIAPFNALAFWAAFTAFTLAPLGLATSAFKLSVLFTILWGFLFFKEERIWERLLGAGVMIAGTMLLLK